MTRIYFNEKSIVITVKMEGFDKTGTPLYITKGKDEEKISEAIDNIGHQQEVVIVDKNPEKLFDILKSKFKFIQAAGGVVVDKGKLMFIFRKGKWDLPKGKLDEGESLDVCAVREVEEETGLINTRIIKPLLITYHSYVENQKNILKETHWFLMQGDSGLALSPQQEEGIEKCIWTDRNDMKSYLEETYPLVRDVMREAMKEF